jgi:large subunit ribosomal protein L25
LNHSPSHYNTANKAKEEPFISTSKIEYFACILIAFLLKPSYTKRPSYPGRGMGELFIEELSMATTFELSAKTREAFGTGASRRLRRLENRVPGILYGAGEPPMSLSFDHNHLLRSLENEAFYSHILTIDIDGKKQKAVLKDLQRHPYKPHIVHLDLLRVTAKEKITMSVPLHFEGEATAPGVKDAGGVMTRLMNSVEVRCLPDALPEFIKVDVSNLGLDEAVHLSQLPLPAGVELIALTHDDKPVVNIHIPRMVEEEPTTAPESAEVPAINVKEDEPENQAEPEQDKE